jgi:hypothetical protein
MRPVRLLLVGLLVLLTALPAPVFADQDRHAVAPAALAGAVADHVAQQDKDRATIRQALERPEVREVAARTGIDIDRIAASIDTLNGAGLSQAAAAAQQVNDTLVGGASNIVISTTTLIIILLIVILIVVAAK